MIPHINSHILSTSMTIENLSDTTVVQPVRKMTETQNDYYINIVPSSTWKHYTTDAVLHAGCIMLISCNRSTRSTTLIQTSVALEDQNSIPTTKLENAKCSTINSMAKYLQNIIVIQRYDSHSRIRKQHHQLQERMHQNNTNQMKVTSPQRIHPMIYPRTITSPVTKMSMNPMMRNYNTHNMNHIVVRHHTPVTIHMLTTCPYQELTLTRYKCDYRPPSNQHAIQHPLGLS